MDEDIERGQREKHVKSRASVRIGDVPGRRRAPEVPVTVVTSRPIDRCQYLDGIAVSIVCYT